MVEGAASLMTMIHAFRLNGLWNEQRGANMLDTGAPFYEVYETSDGQWMAVGAIESQFYVALLEGLGLAGDALLPAKMSAGSGRPEGTVHNGVQDEDARLSGRRSSTGRTPAAPVLSAWEAHTHPHNVARSTFIEVDGVVQPGPPHGSPGPRRRCRSRRCPRCGHGVGARRVGRLRGCGLELRGRGR